MGPVRLFLPKTDKHDGSWVILFNGVLTLVYIYIYIYIYICVCVCVCIFCVGPKREKSKYFKMNGFTEKFILFKNYLFRSSIRVCF